MAIHNGHFRNRNMERRPRSKTGRAMSTWDLADYELHLHYMRVDHMEYDDAAWKVARLNQEWRLCGWHASRLELEGNPESVNEARKLREFFGQERQVDCILVDGDCTCTPRDDMPCSYCREAARRRADADIWAGNFLSKPKKSIEDILEMRGEC